MYSVDGRRPMSFVDGTSSVLSLSSQRGGDTRCCYCFTNRRRRRRRRRRYRTPGGNVERRTNIILFRIGITGGAPAHASARERRERRHQSRTSASCRKTVAVEGGKQSREGQHRRRRTESGCESCDEMVITQRWRSRVRCGRSVRPKRGGGEKKRALFSHKFVCREPATASATIIAMLRSRFAANSSCLHSDVAKARCSNTQARKKRPRPEWTATLRKTKQGGAG